MNVKLLDQIEAESKKDPKWALISQLRDDTLRFLMLVCDPLVTFGVTVDGDDAYKAWSSSTASNDPLRFSDDLYDVCVKLSRRELTGNAAFVAVDGLLQVAPSAQHVKWAMRFLNKKLRAGFTSSTLNKIWPGLIDVFKVSLAEPYEPDKHEIIGDYYLEPKLDGLRMVVLHGRAFTRNGHEIETVKHIIDELGQTLDLDDWVIDGEVMGLGDFDEASGTIRRKSTGTNDDLYYNVFDIVFIEDWERRGEGEPFFDRRRFLEDSVKESQNVKLVPSKRISFKAPATGEQLTTIRDEFIAKGYEGAMLKKSESPYVWKRSDAILKLKKMETVDVPVVSCFEGKGRHKGRLGGVYVDTGGTETKVGSGFDDAQRDELWAQRDNGLIGRVVEVQFQNVTKDGRLRFPVFIKFRPDKD